MKPRLAAWIALVMAGTAQARPLPVPAKSGWKHTPSGIIIPARLGNAARLSLDDRGAVEADLLLQFAGAGITIEANLFRAPIPRVPIWYDRLIQRLGISPAETVRFASPGAPAPDSLRIASADGAAGIAVAVVPRGGYLLSLVVRAPNTIDADAALTTALAAIGWGDARHGDQITPVEPCSSALSVPKARTISATAGDILDDTRSGMNGLTRDKQPDDPLIYCRDPQPLTDATVYRGVEPDGYLIALKESGRIVIVTSSLAHDDRGMIIDKKRYMVALKTPDYRALFRSFATTPTPQQAIAEIRRAPLSYLREGLTESRGMLSLPAR